MYLQALEIEAIKMTEQTNHALKSGHKSREQNRENRRLDLINDFKIKDEYIYPGETKSMGAKVFEPELYSFENGKAKEQPDLKQTRKRYKTLDDVTARDGESLDDLQERQYQNDKDDS